MKQMRNTRQPLPGKSKDAKRGTRKFAAGLLLVLLLMIPWQTSENVYAESAIPDTALIPTPKWVLVQASAKIDSLEIANGVLWSMHVERANNDSTKIYWMGRQLEWQEKSYERELENARPSTWEQIKWSLAFGVGVALGLYAH